MIEGPYPDPDPDPYLWVMYPDTDTGGPKTYGSWSATLLLILIQMYFWVLGEPLKLRQQVLLASLFPNVFIVFGRAASDCQAAVF